MTDSMDMSLSKLQGKVNEEEAWCVAVLGITELDKTLESPFKYKEIKPVNPEGNQS